MRRTPEVCARRDLGSAACASHAAAFAALLASLLVTGCATPPKHVQAVAAAPAVPAPQDPPALVVAQNVLELPDPQPIPPDAVPQRAAPVPPAATADAQAPHPTPTRRPATRDAETSETAQETPAAVISKSTNNRSPLVSADPNLPSVDTIQKRIARVKSLDAGILAKRGKPMPEDVQMIHNRIQFFLEQARQALAHKDLREADSLSSRALVLAEDLLGVR